MNGTGSKELLKSFLNAAIATTGMTVVSFIVNGSLKKNLLVPEVFSEVLKADLPIPVKKHSRIVGWLGHYLLGVSWAMLIDLVYKNTSIKPKVKSGLIIGTFSGLCGIWAWKQIFKSRPVPKDTDTEIFYKQLFIAHILYILLFAALTPTEKSKLKFK